MKLTCRRFCLNSEKVAPYALKGQKLLAQGNALGIVGFKEIAL